jgi:hypothetical protein
VPNNNKEYDLIMNIHNDDATRSMSEYELLRQQKILRNQEKLRSLGLLNPTIETKQPFKSTTATVLQSNKSGNSNIPSKILKHEQPARRVSLRLRGCPPSSISENNRDEENLESIKNTHVDYSSNKSSSGQCASPNNNKAVMKQSVGSKSNKTLTKEHCQMRILTMSTQQLEQRIRIIERMKGQYCVMKLQIMYECCIDEQLYDLANQAKNAIQRLTSNK